MSDTGHTQAEVLRGLAQAPEPRRYRWHKSLLHQDGNFCLEATDPARMGDTTFSSMTKYIHGL
jgi:hypothetical protein